MDFGVKILETARLALREIEVADAPFMLALLNEPSFIENIGDRGVRNLEDAAGYIERGAVASYRRNGFGLYLVELKDGNEPIGICGLVKRDFLPDVDVGFAFRPQYWSRGYAFESASAVLAYARDVLGITRIVGITAPDNRGSQNVLRKLGLEFEKIIETPNAGGQSALFAPKELPGPKA